VEEPICERARLKARNRCLRMAPLARDQVVPLKDLVDPDSPSTKAPRPIPSRTPGARGSCHSLALMRVRDEAAGFHVGRRETRRTGVDSGAVASAAPLPEPIVRSAASGPSGGRSALARV
jgi:hypothetical protein